MSFNDLGLNKEFAASIAAAGYENPTELQQQLIPHIAQGDSVLVWTQSASGKTGSFLIPAINYVLSNPLEEHRGARVLVLTSRRDRVNQITYTIKRLLGEEQQIRSGFIVSGRPYQPQMRLLRRPLDIMIATPGRLNDLVDNNKADFSALEMLIVDDLTAIHKKGLHPLIEKVIAQRGERKYPTIAFVRHDEEVTSYARTLFTGANEITVQDEKTQLLQLNHNVYLSDDFSHKIKLMNHLLSQHRHEPTIIYTNTARTAKSLADSLANHNHIADAVHLLAEEERNTDACPILIEADEENVQADLNGQEHVIHFELPDSTELYTKRMQPFLGEVRSEPPVAILASRTERDRLRKLEEYLGESFPQKKIPGLEPSNKPSKRNTNTSHANNKHKKPHGQGHSKKPQQRQQAKPGDKRHSHNNSSNNTQGARKGPYGRPQNTNNKRKVGSSNYNSKPRSFNGNQNSNDGGNYSIGAWEEKQDYAPARPKPEKKVVIRYKEKRKTVVK